MDIAPRDAFGLALADFGETHDFFVLDGDLSKATKTITFQEKFPDRHINIGIAESNLMGIAAGIASTRSNVFACTFAMFAAGRAYEQVRNSIAYPNLNVKIVGTHGGISIGEDGASHQCIEDLALMRALPNMIVLSPADANEVRAAVEALLTLRGPAYLRLYGKGPWPVVTQPGPFQIGKATEMAAGKDVTLAATGVMLAKALAAREILLEQGITARVLNFSTIKPIDRESITRAAQETGAIVTAEDHLVNGGLGSAVAEVLVETCPVPMARVGLQDVFGRSGKPADLFRLFGMTAGDIALRAVEVIRRKKSVRSAIA